MPLEIEKLKTIEVPAGYHPKPCTGADCSASIYWVRPVGSRGPVPVRCDTAVTYKGEPYDLTRLGLRHPTATEPGRGINHYQECPNAGQFGRKAKPARWEGPPADDYKDPAKVASVQREIEQTLESPLARQREASVAAGVLCTVHPCNDFAVVAVLKHARLVATPCLAHADAVVERAVEGGSCQTAPVTEYLENPDKPSWRAAFIARAAELRARVAQQASQPQSHGERRTGGVGDGRDRQ